MITLAPPVDTHDWVPAAPFRAHLNHLVQHTGLPWQVIALDAGVPIALAGTLLHGRGGRPLARIPRGYGAGLLRVTVESAAALRRTWVDAGPTADRLAELARHHITPEALPAGLGLAPTVLAEVAAGRAAFVTADAALAVRAALAWCDAELTRAAAA